MKKNIDIFLTTTIILLGLFHCIVIWLCIKIVSLALFNYPGIAIAVSIWGGSALISMALLLNAVLPRRKDA